MFDDLNLAVLCGRLATEPDLKTHDSGARSLRFLLTVLSRHPRRRIDVVPVTLFDPPAGLVDSLPGPEAKVWVTGAFQRRCEDGPDGRRTRLEVIADHVTVVDEAVSPPVGR
ncbi:MAG: single-stranded DNA-binding protein [Acidimicrobiia bacterium]|nr:single-stranded DNA-binding protein [Acidimicrobiia bacterium]